MIAMMIPHPKDFYYLTLYLYESMILSISTHECLTVVRCIVLLVLNTTHFYMMLMYSNSSGGTLPDLLSARATIVLK